MPILPTYQGVSTSIATQRTQEAPLDPSGKQVEKLGEATTHLGSTLTHVMQKRQALEDEAMAMQRLQQADSDLRNMQDSFSKNEIGRDARNVYSKTVEENRKTWFKDLTPGASAKLEQHLAPRLLENRSAAYKVENRVRLNDYQAGGNAASTAFVESASRITDYQDGQDTNEYRALREYYRVGEANGYYTKEEADKELEKALVAGSTSRVLKVAASTDKEELENLLKVYTREDIEHDTFLRHIPATKRVELKHTLQGRIEHLNNQEIQKKNQERLDTERMNADLSKSTEIMAEQKLRDPAKYGTLTHDWLDLAGETRLIDGKDLNTWHDRLEKVRRGGAGATGGYGNPELINRLSTSVYTTTTQAEAIAVQQEVKEGIRRGEIPVGEGQPGTVWLNHLEEKAAGPKDEQLTPAKEMAAAKRRLEIELRVTGPMASGPLKGIENSVIGEAFGKLDENAKAGYPKSSQEILDESLDKWKARVGQPASIAAGERRRSLGLPVTQDPKIMGESTKNAVSKALEEIKAAPPGPEGEATREAARTKLMEIKKLVDLETEISYYTGKRGQSSTATKESKPTAGGSGNSPLQSPRK